MQQPELEIQDPAPGPHDSQELLLWERYRRDGDEAARADLLKMHLPYAKVVAATYYGRRMHDEIEFAEYHQLACMGLIEALGRYDPRQQAKFRTFAARRMHGAILDGLERLTEKQQQIAARKRLDAERREQIRQYAVEQAGVDEKLDRKGHSTNDDKVLAFVAEAGLAFALAWLLDGSGMLQRDDQVVHQPFYANSAIRELKSRAAEVVASLPPQEKKVIHGHYYQQQPFEEIAREMGLTKGRISQIHKKALERLRIALADHGGGDIAL
jgi:RNA polymerase sigma factor for flagellar operon FliA